MAHRVHGTELGPVHLCFLLLQGSHAFSARRGYGRSLVDAGVLDGLLRGRAWDTEIRCSAVLSKAPYWLIVLPLPSCIIVVVVLASSW